ncbi:MAG: type IV secretory system conjugative DNA transfer family protein, partial [Acidimicrobiales bacterium]
LGPLVVAGPEPGRLVLGALARRGGGAGRTLLAAEQAQSVAVVGPTQSGKTSALAVPAILSWDGPVLAASVKSDLARDTIGWRRRCGRVWCLDPGRSTGLPPGEWSPLPAATSWAGARRVAADLTEVSRAQGTTADGEFWYATAAKLLAPLLFAAAQAGLSMRDVVRWVDTQEVGEVAQVLAAAGVQEAEQAARATWLRDERQRSAVYTTAETVLEPFADAPPDHGGPVDAIDPAGLLLGAHTLYLCAPAHDQRRLRGLFTAVVKQVLEAAFERAARLGGRLAPPLLVVLDEAANIAPLAELDGLAATCAGHGVQLVTVWQDLAQVAARYGERSQTVVNNHRAKVFLSGTSDPRTLDHASHLVGDEELLVPSVTTDPSGARSVTTSTVRRRLLPPEALRRLPTGAGVLVYGSLPPARLTLRPWFVDPVLAARGRAGSPWPVRGGGPASG